MSILTDSFLDKFNIILDQRYEQAAASIWLNYAEHLEAIIKVMRFNATLLVGVDPALVQQACARLGRAFYTVTITADTDDADLLGYVRQSDGAFIGGALTLAMAKGAVLILDGLEHASPSLTCLYPVLCHVNTVRLPNGTSIVPVQGFTLFAHVATLPELAS